MWVRCLGQEDPLEMDNSLQYSFWENPMERRAWGAMVHGFTESDMTEATEYAPMQSGNSS